MKPNIRFLRKVRDGLVVKRRGYTRRRGGYIVVRGGEASWLKHAAAGYVTPPEGVSLGYPSYAKLTDSGRAALASADRSPQGRDGEAGSIAEGDKSATRSEAKGDAQNG